MAEGLEARVPLLEYDGDRQSVLMPDHEKLGHRLPERAVFAFLGDCVDAFAAEAGCPVIARFETITKRFPVYLVARGSRRICLCQAPLGAPAAAQFMDWLIGYGVRKVIAAGSCGALEDLPENAFIVPRRALRDEGTSYHYLPPARHIALDGPVQETVRTVLRGAGIPFVECDTWTTDGFYRETAAKIARRRAEGCGCVEMECAALAACARFRGAAFGQFLYTADSLASVEAYDERGWGADSLRPALELCLRVAEAM